jgi:predicted hydrocarbon binding protein
VLITITAWGYPVIDFFKEYVKTCRDFIGSANNPLLYQTGEKVARAFKHASLEDLQHAMVEKGLRFTYIETPECIIFTVPHSFETEVHRNTEKPCCHMLRGFFKEITRNYTRHSQVRCIETKCKAKGDGMCEFRAEIIN